MRDDTIAKAWARLCTRPDQYSRSSQGSEARVNPVTNGVYRRVVLIHDEFQRPFICYPSHLHK